jgi:hypothetical protein
MEKEKTMTFDEWLRYDIENGYCVEQTCNTHDGVPLTEYENAQFDEGFDPCVHVVRLGAPEDWDNGE